MQTTANVTEAKRVRAAPTFSSTEVEKWDLLLRAYLKRDEAENVLDRYPPTPDMGKLRTSWDLMESKPRSRNNSGRTKRSVKTSGHGRMASRTLPLWKGVKTTMLQCLS